MNYEVFWRVSVSWRHALISSEWKGEEEEEGKTGQRTSEIKPTH